MIRFIQLSTIFACALLFATEGLAQQQQKPGSISFTNVGVPVGLVGLNSEVPTDYMKYYLCFTAEGVPSYLSSDRVGETSVSPQPFAFACPKGTTFQMRIIQYDGSYSLVAEEVSNAAVASNEMVVRILQ